MPSSQQMEASEQLTAASLEEHAGTLRSIRVGLEEARRRGVAFERAWSTVLGRTLLALPANEHAEWLVALEATKATWQTAYTDVAVQRAA